MKDWPDWIRAIFDGVDPSNWWDGFVGAFCGVIFSAVLTLLVVRMQRSHDRSLVERQIEAEQANTQLQLDDAQRRDAESALESAYTKLTELLLALADRTRRYTEQPYYDEAVRDQKQWNLLNDCRRELANLIPKVRDERLRETLLKVPEAFEQFAEHFTRRVEAAKRGQAVPDQRVWSATIRSYAANVVDQVTRCRSGEAAVFVAVPIISYD